MSKDFDVICRDLADALKQGRGVDSVAVRNIIRRHYEWIKKFWMPNRESYINLGAGYLGSEWEKAFEPHDAHHPRLATFLAEAMKHFADHELK